jgi:hypothetical protein
LLHLLRSASGTFRVLQLRDIVGLLWVADQTFSWSVC